MALPIRYAYLHGFGSGSNSRKGTALHAIMKERGVHLELPDLNIPSFAQLTLTASLEYLDAQDAEFDGLWRFIGSSWGGYVAARWAELRPHRVDRLLLLCPGFELTTRWVDLFGPDAMTRWRTQGSITLPNAAGQPTEVWWRFIEDMQKHPAVPTFTQPTVIIHGIEDTTVAIDSSQRVAAQNDHVELISVDDDHGLMSSIDLIASEVFRFLVGMS